VPDRTPLRVLVHRRFTDLDPLGHVNNVAYFDYLQEARIGLLNDVGLVQSRTFAQVVVKQELTHLKPLLWSSQPLIVETWIEGVRNSSYTVRYRIIDESGEIAAEAATVCAVVDPATTKPIRMNSELRAVLEPLTLST
jgi:acyl-CoA thioester hydrolase